MSELLAKTPGWVLQPLKGRSPEASPSHIGLYFYLMSSPCYADIGAKHSEAYPWMITELHISLFDLVISLSEAMDLVSPSIVNHHKRVAYIASSLGAELGLSQEEQTDLFLAGALHDSGALSLKERMDTFKFEMEEPYRHAELGYLLLREFPPFLQVSRIVRHHHRRWEYGEGRTCGGDDVPLGSHILHLADRVDVLLKREKGILCQVRGICKKIKKEAGKRFMPEVVDAFMELADREYFWLDAASPSLDQILSRKRKASTVEVDLDTLLDLSRLFSKIIDFRSRFTATHSSGVATIAEALARLLGFSERECRMMRVAGHLHDLGKLAVPSEILEKPGRLTPKEFCAIKTHTFYTYRILERIEDLEIINAWASFHHERLDGNGYPFHHRAEDLSLGSRIMAVADVFTGITEDRPYRKGMSEEQALEVLEGMVASHALDGYVVSIAKAHYEELNSLRKEVQAAMTEEYERFGKGERPTSRTRVSSGSSA